MKRDDAAPAAVGVSGTWRGFGGRGRDPVRAAIDGAFATPVHLLRAPYEAASRPWPRAIARAVSDGLVPTDGWPTRHVYLDDDAPAIARVRAVVDGLKAVPDAAVFRVVSDVVALRRVRRRERYTRRASEVAWG